MGVANQSVDCFRHRASIGVVFLALLLTAASGSAQSAGDIPDQSELVGTWSGTSLFAVTAMESGLNVETDEWPVTVTVNEDGSGFAEDRLGQFAFTWEYDSANGLLSMAVDDYVSQSHMKYLDSGRILMIEVSQGYQAYVAVLQRVQ